jgi:sugar-phosphatase
VTTWPRALLFDMDGTLIESHANVERAWTTWARARDLDPAEVLAEAHGLPAEVTVARWLPDADDDAIAAAAAEQLAIQYDDVTGITPIDGVPELLEFLGENAVPWAVHTSADARLARVRLDAAGIAPPVLVTRDQLDRGKPAPDGYLRAAEILEIEPEQCIVIEDTPVGIESGRAAGMTTVGVRSAAGDLPLRAISDLHLWLTIALRNVHDNEEGEPDGLPFFG